MDPLQALAILSFGAFLMVLVTAVFYVFTVRPRLLEPISLAALGTLDLDLQGELSEQRAAVERLNAALAEHTAQLQQAAVTAPPLPGLDQLRHMLSVQTETVQAMMGLLYQHTERLSRLDTRLERLELSAPGLAEGADHETLRQLIQAQADHLVAISRRLDQWSMASARTDERLAEHARILAALDRELAEQAQALRTIDTRLGEHTTLLLDAATERRAQGGMLEALHTQLTRVFPLLNRLLAAPPRPGQDRLTDIKGIGPVYAGKLYEAGIQTFKQLAAMTPEEIHLLINEPKWRARSINAEAWIEQARLLASQREKVETIG